MTKDLFEKIFFQSGLAMIDLNFLTPMSSGYT
jgi:hypothetical protein